VLTQQLGWYVRPCATLACARSRRVRIRRPGLTPRGLTAREQEILQLVASGQSNDEISASLFISVRTVEHHVSAILGKLGVTTRKSAAQEARRLGIIDFHRVSVAAATKSR
jgi:DNA-binding NarL/FixJ family response regulator